MPLPYMHCPNCGADVHPRTRCGACGAFAMAKALYRTLQEIADADTWVSRTKQVDELESLGFVRWVGRAEKRFAPTESGLRALLKWRY